MTCPRSCYQEHSQGVCAFRHHGQCNLAECRRAQVESIPADTLAKLAAAVPMGRFGEPQEMAPAVGFLGSDEAAHITGVVLVVDGGISI